MNEQHKQTIREALEYRKERTERFIDTMSRHGVANNEYRERIAAIDAALAALDEPEWTPLPQSLEYDVITYIMRHNQLPSDDEYAICRRPPRA